MTHLFEENGHQIGIPDRYMTAEVQLALIERGPRVAVALCEQVTPR